MILIGILAALMALLGNWHLRMLPPDQGTFPQPKNLEERLSPILG